MPRAHPSTRWDPNPNDPEVRRWKSNLARGSASTGDAWYRALRRFCGAVQRTPAELLSLKPRSLRDLFLDFADADAKTHKGSTTAFTLKVASHWLRFNGVTPPTGVKVKDAEAVYEETALTPDQLRAALGPAGPREKMAILLMAQGGLRPEVLGNFLGDDGLRLSDLPELEISGKKASFRRAPSAILVRRDLSKASHQYLTFAGAEASGAVVDYLQARMSAGERLSPKSALFAPDRPDMTERTHVRTTVIGDVVRRAFRAAGLKNRPYVLRTTAASRFSEAENRGLVSHAYWQFWMGHKGDMSARYSVERGALPETTLEEMRRAYRRCEPLLSSIPRASFGGSEAIRALLVAVGVPKEDAGKLDLDALTPEQIAELAEKVPARPAKRAAQRLVPLEEANALLAQGWEPVSVGPAHVILREPESSPVITVQATSREGAA